eukprot:scaffold3453_cov253-Pinguiococcus_pyrenoidosus.AAC.2
MSIKSVVVQWRPSEQALTQAMHSRMLSALRTNELMQAKPQPQPWPARASNHSPAGFLPRREQSFARLLRCWPLRSPPDLGNPSMQVVNAAYIKKKVSSPTPSINGNAVSETSPAVSRFSEVATDIALARMLRGKTSDAPSHVIGPRPEEKKTTKPHKPNTERPPSDALGTDTDSKTRKKMMPDMEVKISGRRPKESAFHVARPMPRIFAIPMNTVIPKFSARDSSPASSRISGEK